MSDVKQWSTAARASLPEKYHLRSGDSSQMPTASRTVWCSAIGSPKSEIQSQPSHSPKVPPSRRCTASNPVRSSPSGYTPVGAGTSMTRAAAAAVSKGAASAGSAGIGTSTGRIVVGVARRVSS